MQPAVAKQQDQLSVPLADPPRSLVFQCAMFNALWNKGYTVEEYTTTVARGLAPYFHYYERQCQSLPREFAIRATHRHVVMAIQYLQMSQETRGEIEQRLESPPNQLDGQTTSILIPLTVRLWLMISIGSMGTLVYAGQRPIKWAEGERLKEIIEAELPRHHTITGKVELPKAFNARNIEQQACIMVAWTLNLADHLLLKEEDQEDGGAKVLIFHHASFLKHHQESGSKFLQNDLLDETIRTLALLFPQMDPKSRKWFQGHRARFGLDPAAAECGFLSRRERQIDSFHYWRDRLAILKQAFDEAEPRSISGVWRDDRKKMQYYTFWIAVVILALTVVFGLVQTITGIVQAWAAVKSLNRH